MNEPKKCDGACGRDAVTRFGKFDLCEQCAEELDSNGPFPKPAAQDLIDLPDCEDCGERPGTIKYKQKLYCSRCFEWLRELEFPGDVEL